MANILGVGWVDYSLPELSWSLINEVDNATKVLSQFNVTFLAAGLVQWRKTLHVTLKKRGVMRLTC